VIKNLLCSGSSFQKSSKTRNNLLPINISRSLQWRLLWGMRSQSKNPSSLRMIFVRLKTLRSCETETHAFRSEAWDHNPKTQALWEWFLLGWKH
jgi:hypothetical protein